MFFMMGINNQQKKLDFNQVIICSICGQYGRYEVYRICTVLSLFFIPVFKWGKKYYVRTTCCESVYIIDSEVGKQIERGEISEIKSEQLHFVEGQRHYKKCTACGYRTKEDFDFCPKCGNAMK